jgi:hypothetical protein
MNVHPFSFSWLMAMLAKAPELMGSKPHRIPHKRTFGRKRNTRNNHICHICLVTKAVDNSCKNRMCKEFVGPRDSVNPDVNSLDRATRLAAQPQRRAKRLAKNCKRPTMTTDRRPR